MTNHWQLDVNQASISNEFTRVTFYIAECNSLITCCNCKELPGPVHTISSELRATFCGSVLFPALEKTEGTAT